jgi:hypothetical protein
VIVLGSVATLVLGFTGAVVSTGNSIGSIFGGGTSSSTAAADVPLVLTVDRSRTVIEHGKPVVRTVRVLLTRKVDVVSVKQVPVVQTVFSGGQAHTETVFATRYITKARLVPVTKTTLVTSPGKTITRAIKLNGTTVLVTTALPPQTQTVQQQITVDRPVTVDRQVNVTQVETTTKTQTQTLTQTQIQTQTQTQTQTVTLPAQTVTLPGTTVTLPGTTVTTTVTTTKTVTVTAPATTT